MRIMATLLIVVGVIGVILTGKTFFGREEVEDEVSLSSDHFEHIVVDGDMGNVKVIPSTSDNIEISWKGSLYNARSTDELVSIEENNTELKVNIGKKRFFNFSFFNLNFRNKLQVYLYLPDKQFNSLVVKNNVGNTEVNGIRVENLTTETDVSNLTIENVSANSIVAETDVGNLTLNDVQGKIYAKSDVGNIMININEIQDDMEITSNVGKVGLTVPEVPNNVTFNADSSVGNVRVFGERGSYINKNAEYVVSMTTDVGNIRVDEK
ncbi:DUF4097 domain-containing protein [Virgibacillus sp. MSJ-26]|nr:DUF4097 domain-containing protein [Virgibacillus sp. MSJ-26]